MSDEIPPGLMAEVDRELPLLRETLNEAVAALRDDPKRKPSDPAASLVSIREYLIRLHVAGQSDFVDNLAAIALLTLVESSWEPPN